MWSSPAAHNSNSPSTTTPDPSRRGTAHQIFILTVLLCPILHHVPGTGEGKGERVTLVRIIDGDTFEVVRSSGEREKVRLIGIDCPESHTNPKLYRDSNTSHRRFDEIVREGRLATETVASMMKSGEILDVEFDVQIRDRYGRLLVYLYLVDGRMLNELLLIKGVASLMTVPPNVKYVDRFLAAFKSAHAKDAR